METEPAADVVVQCGRPIRESFSQLRLRLFVNWAEFPAMPEHVRLIDRLDVFVQGFRLHIIPHLVTSLREHESLAWLCGRRRRVTSPEGAPDCVDYPIFAEECFALGIVPAAAMREDGYRVVVSCTGMAPATHPVYTALGCSIVYRPEPTADPEAVRLRAQCDSLGIITPLPEYRNIAGVGLVRPVGASDFDATRFLAVDRTYPVKCRHRRVQHGISPWVTTLLLLPAPERKRPPPRLAQVDLIAHINGSERQYRARVLREDVVGDADRSDFAMIELLASDRKTIAGYALVADPLSPDHITWQFFERFGRLARAGFAFLPIFGDADLWEFSIRLRTSTDCEHGDSPPPTAAEIDDDEPRPYVLCFVVSEKEPRDDPRSPCK